MRALHQLASTSQSELFQHARYVGTRALRAEVELEGIWLRYLMLLIRHTQAPPNP